MGRQRILIATRHFPPDGGALSFRMKHLAETMAADHTVTVIASQPNRYGDESRAPKRQEIDGITVHRVSAGGLTRFRGKAGRLFSETLGALIMGFAALARRKRGDVVVVSAPPLTYALPGWMMKRIGRRQVVLDVRDLWLDWAEETGVVKSGLLLRVLRRLERSFIEAADHITVTTSGFATELVTRFGVDPDRITVVYNGLDDEVAPLPAESASTPDGAIEVLYAGNLGPSQNLTSLVKGMTNALDAHEQLRITIVGNGAQADVMAAVDHDRFAYLPAVDRDELQRIYTRADAYLLHLADLAVYRHTVPSKTFEYAGYGRPILCGVMGEARDIAARHTDCYYFDSDDPASLANAIDRLVGADPPDNAADDRGERSEILRSSRSDVWLSVFEGSP